LLPPPQGEGRPAAAGGGGRPPPTSALVASLILTTSTLSLAGPYADHVTKLDDPATLATIVAAGEAALPDVAEALKGPRPDLAAMAIGRIGRPAGAAMLIPLAEDKDGELRATVAWALGRCNDPGALPALLKLADDPYAPAQAAAIEAIAQSAAPEAKAALEKAIVHPSEAVRLCAVRGIRASKRTDLLPAMANRLESWIEQAPNEAYNPKAPPGPGNPMTVPVVRWREPSAPVRLAIIEALGDLKVVDALPALIGAMEREDSYARLAIVSAIESVGTPAAGVCLGRIVPIPYDEAAFRDHMPLLLTNGTLAVIAGRLGDERCVPHLLNTLKLPRQNLGKDKDLTELYIETVKLLGQYKVERAARPLAGLLKEAGVQQLADATVASLRQIGPAAARPLAQNLDQWQLAPMYLRLLREPGLRTYVARDAIIGFLSHESDEVRLEATETLGLYLAEGVLDEYDVPMLEAMYLDPSRDVRGACEKWKAVLKEKWGDELR
jgi:hypothetical protein